MTSFLGLGAVIGAVDTIVNQFRTDNANQQLGGANATGGKFEVDLPTLYQYFNDVKTTHENLTERIAKLTATGSAPKPAATDIAGVTQSITSSVDGATGARDSLLGALHYTANQLAEHLGAISTIYMQYINADEQHAASLNAAGNPSAAKYTISSASPDPVTSAAPKADISSLFAI